jgi:hypothetical protein
LVEKEIMLIYWQLIRKTIMFVEEIRLGVSVGREDGLVSKYEIILMFL